MEIATGEVKREAPRGAARSAGLPSFLFDGAARVLINAGSR
jgi:hypothetical protein